MPEYLAARKADHFWKKLQESTTLNIFFDYFFAILHCNLITKCLFKGTTTEIGVCKLKPIWKLKCVRHICVPADDVVVVIVISILGVITLKRPNQNPWLNKVLKTSTRCRQRKKRKKEQTKEIINKGICKMSKTLKYSPCASVLNCYLKNFRT